MVTNQELAAAILADTDDPTVTDNLCMLLESIMEFEIDSLAGYVEEHMDVALSDEPSSNEIAAVCRQPENRHIYAIAWRLYLKLFGDPGEEGGA